MQSLLAILSNVLADVCKPGWSYFGGICYATSHSCKNWTEAQQTCQTYNANLINVKNQEENVYVQHRLNGAKGWIGLSDRDSEGTFVWSDNQPNNFTYWAKNQPITSKMRIAFTPWVYDIALCGMMWAETAVITTPVLKVRLRELFPS